jgi:hypothetical protein
MKKRVWHYTKGYNIEAIRQSGTLQLTKAGLPRTDEHERLAVWFSQDQLWDRSVGSMDAVHKMFGGLYRIGVDPTRITLIDFATYLATSGISATTARVLERAGREMGADPSEWLCSYEPIRAADWVAVESYHGRRWVEAEK